MTIFFSSMIIFIDNMTQVSDQWLDAKRITDFRIQGKS